MQNSKHPINLTNIIFFIVTPILAVVSTSYWVSSGQFNWATIIFAFIFMTAAGMSITAGYHRLFSHRSYDAAKPVQYFYVFFGSANFEGSVIDWSADHRIHHRFQDKDEDPYAIKKGFWFAHIGWLFTKNWKSDLAKVKDLHDDPVIRFQHEHFVPIASFMAFIFPMLVCGLGWGDWIGGFFVAGVLRMVLNQHFTFLINSLCHFVGKKTYSDKLTARDNWFTALLTYGEGYHNFHHTFPGDYRNGIRSYDFDPTKWLIYGLSKIGMASRLREVSLEKIITKKVAMQEINLARKLSIQSPAVANFATETLAAAKKQLELASDRLSTIRDEYYSLKSEKNEEMRHKIEEIRIQFRDAQREFAQSVAMWKAMTRGLSKLAA